MATGIQTGMRTGSRAGMTAGRGAPGKPGGGGLGKLKEIWGGLGKTAKIAIGALVVVAISGALFAFAYTQGNAPVDLYTTKMPKEDVTQCAALLTEKGISHSVKVTEDGIQLNPKDRGRARALLAANGLPRHAIQTTPDSGALGKTQAEARMMRQRVLEGEITEALRQMEGVGDAYVKIATPDEAAFAENAKPTQARVMLKLNPGTTLGEKEVEAVVHLVAYSVPELDKKNVKVVDTQMKDLTAMLEQSEDGSVPTGKMGAMETEKADLLRKKAQEQLDQVLGEGQSKVAVTVEMDYSQKETKSRLVGGASDDGKLVTGSQTKVERYAKNPGGNSGSDPAQTMSDNPEDEEITTASGSSSVKGKNSNYENITKSEKVDYNRTETTVVQKTPEIKRISASVVLDNVKPDVEARILGMVKATIGIDENRGDVITATSLPFHKATLTSLAGATGATGNGDPNAFAPTQQSSGMNPTVIGMALFGPAVLMLGLIAVYLLKQHRVQADRSSLHLGSHHGSTSTDIADLLTDKSGKVTSVTETKVNTSDALEKLAKERPTKVAEMLKSTWLSG
ncbi:MAG: flagellar M-ring protein FliF [Candidatus Eremiobacteraeota bacterium]|nr:flagellar M-ring protein FliF [Candidatus Eremiobacteraeota bacterium]